MKSMAGKIFFAAISVLYPIIVYCGLVFWGLSPRRLSVLLLVLALSHFLGFTRSKSNLDRWRIVLLVVLVLACAFTAFFLDNVLFVKFYPVLVSVSLLAFFAFTLIKPPNFAFRMASLADKSLADSPSRPAVERYCTKVQEFSCDSHGRNLVHPQGSRRQVHLRNPLQVPEFRDAAKRN